MSQSDRELLEAAAEAAGIDHVAGYAWGEDGSAWNPLTDDGDALRLAIARNMNVFHAAGSAFAMDEDGEFEACEPHGNDKAAATRRAIVRAAAAMAGDT